MGKPIRLSIIREIALTPFEDLPKACQYPQCEKPSASRGLCKHHYSYFYKYINADLPKYRLKPSGRPDYGAPTGSKCSMCKDPSDSLGFCSKHYARYRAQQKKLSQEVQSDNRV